jgi:hypothetical protein
VAPEERVVGHRQSVAPRGTRQVTPNAEAARDLGPEDQVHASVAFRVDKNKCNNPPVGVMVVDDTGRRLREFEHV